MPWDPNREIVVTIRLTDSQYEICRKWASVSRSLNTAARLLTSYHSDSDEEDICAQELKDLEPLLNNLHQQVRTAIWEKERARQS